MAKLGTPQTKKFQIGTAELRVGPLSLANKLTQAHSVGLVDSVTFEISQESIDLEGGFPKVLIDSVISKQISGVTATLREFSRRNMQMLAGEGVAAAGVVDVESLVVTDQAAGITFDVTAADGANFAEGDILTIYPAMDPAMVSVVKVASIATDTITLEADTPTLYAYNGTTDVIKVFKAAPIAIGAASSTKYFAAQLVQLENATGRPIVINFWKCSNGSGLSYATNADDFASTELSLKTLVPSADEYGTGADLEHLAGLISQYPTGMFAGGAD